MITTPSNKTEPNGSFCLFIIGSSAHKYLEANIISSKYVFLVFSYEIGGLVALFTGVDIHEHYAWSAII